MKEVLDRLAGGESFDKVVKETGVTARVEDAYKRGGAPVHMVLQEGGSSRELYLHAYATPEKANEFRVSCAKGAYRTSPVIEVPPDLAALGETFYQWAERVLLEPIDFECAPIPRNADRDAG